ncbi:MAG TPA: hypothetical protein VFT59_06085 [Candidatus Saccharimonadales bacterium]|nr:hypothetical protein [Candidatus Saccharimonadales bacterium]
MSKTSTLGSSRKKMMPTKLVMGLMVAAVSVLVGTAGVASAMPQNGGHGYGGDINIGIGDIIGDNNVIIIIVNYFTGK